MLTKIGHFGQFLQVGGPSMFWSKIEILVKNRNFGQKSKFCSKNWNFGQKSKFWSKNRTFDQKFKNWPQIEILAKNRNFGQKSPFWNFLTFYSYFIFLARRGHDLRTKRRKSLVPARSHVIEIDLEVEIIHVVATTEDGLDRAQSADQKRSPFLTYARE